MNNVKKAYAEVYCIINLLDEDYKNKIPLKLINFFNEEKDNNYNAVINPDVSLEKQNLLKETVDILAMLKLHYWCKNKEEEQELLNLLNENEKRHQAELREKYNPDDLFKRNVKTNTEPIIHNTVEQNHELLVYPKENVFSRIIRRIKSLFQKN